MIYKLMHFEEQMLEKYQQDKYKSETLFIKDIEKLLGELSICHKSIKNDKELKWVCNAIVRWKRFLSTKFDIFNQTAIPTIESIPIFQEEESDSKEDILPEKINYRTLEEAIEKDPSMIGTLLKGVTNLIGKKHFETQEAILNYLKEHDKKVEREHKKQQLFGPHGYPLTYGFEESKEAENIIDYSNVISRKMINDY